MYLLNWFQSQEASPSVLLLDGGVSTFLESTSSQKNQVFEHRSLWSSSLLLTQEGRDEILSCHEKFLASGANIVSTVTYQCHFHVYDYDKQMKTVQEVDESTMTAMLRDGVRLARMAAENTSQRHGPTITWVVASSGCYGSALADGSEYKGKYALTTKELTEFHDRKAQVLVEEKPDAIAFETVPCSLELQAILNLLQEKHSSEPWKKVGVWISFSCQNELQLNDGSSFEQALDMLCTMDPHATLVHAVGINCCNVHHISSLAQRLVRHMIHQGPRRGIVLYPNSGEEWDARNGQWLDKTGCTVPNEFAEIMIQTVQDVCKTWRQEQKDGNAVAPPKMIVGGCCRTSPATIQAMRQRLDTML